MVSATFHMAACGTLAGDEPVKTNGPFRGRHLEPLIADELVKEALKLKAAEAWRRVPWEKTVEWVAEKFELSAKNKKITGLAWKVRRLILQQCRVSQICVRRHLISRGSSSCSCVRCMFGGI